MSVSVQLIQFTARHRAKKSLKCKVSIKLAIS
uniref:Uncharacterized protein n=1 Tax=Anguilla anguilla TaxID=7936 RepID=A0A0E9V078_ANGAN